MMEELRVLKKDQPSGGKLLSEASAAGVEGRLIFSEATDVSGFDPSQKMLGVEWFEASALNVEGHDLLLRHVSADALTYHVRGVVVSGSPMSSLTGHVAELAWNWWPPLSEGRV